MNAEEYWSTVRSHILLPGLIWLVAAALGCTSVRRFDDRLDECDQACSPPFVTETPVQFHQGLAIVEAQVEGLGRPARLAIDTGSITLLRRDLESQLEFVSDESPPNSVAADAHGNDVDVESIILRRLSVGGLEFREVPAALVESQVFDFVCPPIDGLLGRGWVLGQSGLLDRVAIEIDRDRQRVRWSRDGSLLGRRGDITATLPLESYVINSNGEKAGISRSTWIPVVVEGQAIWAVLDTGSAGLSTMTRDVFSDTLGRNIEDEDVREFVGQDAMGLGGPGPVQQNWIAQIRDVRLGRFQFPTYPFKIVPSREDGVPTIILTQNLLQHFNYVLDYQRSEMRVSLAEDRPATEGLELQLYWLVADGRLVITGMLADGVARQAGVELGDEVVMLNDTVLSPTDPQLICRVSSQWRSSQDALRLRLRRDDHEFDVTLPRMETELAE